MSATNCITLSNIDESLGCGQDNMGGIVPKLFFGYWDDVDVWPDFPEPAQNATSISMETAGKLVGDVVMKVGTCAYQIDFTDETGLFSIVPQGEKGGISFLYQLTFINKRIRALILGFLNAAKNRKMFFIVQDSNGTYYLMGDKRRGALLSTGDGAVTGTATTDQNQVTSVFEYVSPRALTYEGDVEDLLEVRESE